jgi:xanthine dehydrogenase accessory factor
MRDMVDLRQFWQNNEGQKLALCTLVRKQHFGYRAIGAKKIVTLEGTSCGLLSGGCLEGDINKAARDNWDKMPFIQSFSTMDEADRFFGYQSGCSGVIDILFEVLPPDIDMDLYFPFGDDLKAKGISVALNDPKSTNRIFSDEVTIDENVFFDPWVKPINLYVIGCGADAPAFAELVPPLGWTLRFIDYRGGFSLPDKYLPYHAEIMPLDDIAQQIPESDRTAVILMTHNYEADMAIFSKLIDRKFGYLGCLGPRKRYEQLKADLLKMQNITVTPEWESIVHSPAGLFVNGRSPEEIALSIIAQIQSLLRTHDRK